MFLCCTSMENVVQLKLRYFALAWQLANTWERDKWAVLNCFILFLRNDKSWHDQRIPVSKFIMMPRKMAEYHQPFNEVAFDFMKLVRNKRKEDNLLSDVVFSLNKWSLECKNDLLPQAIKYSIVS